MGCFSSAPWQRWSAWPSLTCGHGRRFPSTWEGRGGVAVFWSCRGGQWEYVLYRRCHLCLVDCSNDNSFAWKNVPSAVKNQSLAFSWGSDYLWEQAGSPDSKCSPRCWFTGILHASRRQFLTTSLNSCLCMDFLLHLSLQPPKQCLDASKIELVMVLKGCWIIPLPNSSPIFCAAKLIKMSPEQLGKQGVWQYFKNLVKIVKYWNVKARIDSQRDISESGFLFSSLRNTIELYMCHICCNSSILVFHWVYPNQCTIWDHVLRGYRFHKRLERSAFNYWFFWLPMTWTSQIIKQLSL